MAEPKLEGMSESEVRLLQTLTLDQLLHLLGGRKREYLAAEYSARFLRYFDLMVARREENRARKRADKAKSKAAQMDMFK